MANSRWIHLYLNRRLGAGPSEQQQPFPFILLMSALQHKPLYSLPAHQMLCVPVYVSEIPEVFLPSGVPGASSVLTSLWITNIGYVTNKYMFFNLFLGATKVVLFFWPKIKLQYH